ncbi:MAG TPA: peptide chain release factor N(5)-glutamine methyltransferase [Vicinamibacterales bacterium]|nr:peptide chain release factor N(5)-glutamine methyltransferase [Vicinamibacterales bacterium]
MPRPTKPPRDAAGAPLQERIAEARRALTCAGVAEEEAALDADVLARHVLGWDRASLLARNREPAPTGFDAAFAALVSRRSAREPVALITGHREFWGIDLLVTPDVLVPRPETELVVETAIEVAERRRCRRIADIGTGSGCLAIALALEFPEAAVVATDVSRAALDLARQNAARHGVDRRVDFRHGDLLAPLDGEFDLIVSNPPYVPAGTPLPPEVERYEPHAALFAGDDGLDVIRELIRAAPAHLASGGVFVVEFGFGQADAARDLAAGAGWRVVSVRTDLQGIPRVAAIAAKR